MRRSLRVCLLAALVIGVMIPAPALAQKPLEAVETFETTKNMKPLGVSERVPIGTGLGDVNSDLAFRGDHAFQGHFTGFRIIDISDPDDPVEITNVENCGVSRTSTTGGQGDVIVWEDILVRSWDGAAGGSCAGLTGVSGLHVFDISDILNPVAVGVVNLPQGSHTATGVPDLENDRLLVYSSPSNAQGVDIVEVPFDDPSSATYLYRLASGTPFSGALVNLVDVHEGGAAGTYAASGSAWHPDPTAEGVTGNLALVDDGSANPTLGCAPLVGFPAGSIALVDRGDCPFVQKVMNAEAAGAIGVIVLNNTGGNPTQMGGETHEIGIPSGMVSQDTGNLIRANLPTTGTLRRHPDAVDIARVCHDTGVILGDVMKAACAGGNGVTVWSMHPDDGGSLEHPVRLWSRSLGTGIGHSAAFTWDGEVIVFGHEPGGGTQARCQATSSELDRTLFFLDAETGHTVGTMLHPRPQAPTENCTWHNYNIVPTDKRYVMVSGNYQSGISVVDFTDPANAREIAYADPAPLVHPTNPNAILTGGDWSTYWYDGRIYQSDIRRGLIIWQLSDPAVAGARKFGHLNPQTQETSFPFKGTARGRSPVHGPGDGHDEPMH